MENVGILGSSVTIFEFEKKRNKKEISFRMFCLQTKFYQQPKFWLHAVVCWCCHLLKIIYNYPPKGRRIVVDINRDAKRWGIYPLLFTDPEGDSNCCFSIYHIRWIKNASSISSSETFAKRRPMFLFIRKTVNIQGYSELREPIKTRKNCYPLIWWIY